MTIIDFVKKGNLVRFYLGYKTEEDGWTNPSYRDHYYTDTNPPKPCDRYYGDDWDDRPYEHNAGEVYEEFVKGYCDIVFPMDTIVVEPADDYYYGGNSPFCKDDFVARKAPCIVAKRVREDDEYDDDRYSKLIAADRPDTHKFYFGDELEPTINGDIRVWKWGIN